MSDKTIEALRPAGLKAEEPVWEGKWKNLDFDKDGKSYRNNPVFDYEAEAKEDSDYAYYWIINSPISTGKWNTMDGILTLENYSHTIQIPWKEKD